MTLYSLPDLLSCACLGFILGLIAGAWSYRNYRPPQVRCRCGKYLGAKHPGCR